MKKPVSVSPHVPPPSSPPSPEGSLPSSSFLPLCTVAQVITQGASTGWTDRVLLKPGAETTPVDSDQQKKKAI